MAKIWALVLAAFVVLTASAAGAQAVKQSGAIVPYHAPAWYGNGQMGDGGSVASPFISTLALFNGASCPLSISSQTGPGVSAAPAGLLTICQTATQTVFTIAGINGQATPSVFFNIGGTLYPFPGGGGGGGVVGPGVTIVGDVACWNNLIGTLLSDCGARLVTPMTTVSGNLTCWNNTTGTLVSDCAVPSMIASNFILGNTTGSTAVLQAVALPSNCNTSNSALNWTVGVGWSCRSISGGGSGSVTQVNTGAGLIGGPITTTGTISVTTAVNAQTGTTYTMLSSDSAGIVTLSNGSAIAVTLPTPTGSFGAGFSTTFCDLGAGTATLTPTAATINGASTYTLTTGNCVSPVSDGSNYQVVPETGQANINASAAYRLNGVLAASATPPTIASGFGTSPSVVVSNGTLAFTVNVGTSNTGTGVLTFPAAAHGWACHVNDITTKSTTVASTQVTATGATSLTVQNYSDVMGTHAWVDSDVLQFLCAGY